MYQLWVLTNEWWLKGVYTSAGIAHKMAKSLGGALKVYFVSRMCPVDENGVELTTEQLEKIMEC